MTKSRQDMTKGNVTSTILLFSLPIFLGNIFQQAYNLADTAIAGHFLGDDALSAIGASASLYSFLMYFIGGMNGGFSLVLAKCFGEKNNKKLKDSIGSLIIQNIIISAIAMIIGILALKPILILLNTPNEIVVNAYSYILIIYLGAGVMACYNAQSNLLRALGDSATPIVFLVVSSICNIILDILFIGKLNLDVKGAALATVISQVISCILCQITIEIHYKEYKINKENLKFSKDVFSEMFSSGITMALMNCIFAIGSLIQQSAINGFGKLTIAGHLGARKIVELFMQPMITISTACSTFVSQNFGAKKYDRIKKAIKSSIIIEFSISLFVIFIIYCFSDFMIKAVTSTESQEVISTAKTYLYINAPCFLALGILYVLRTSVQSIGKHLPPLLSSGIELVVKIIGAFVLAKYFGYTGVAFAEPTSWVLGALLLIYSFTKAYKQIINE